MVIAMNDSSVNGVFVGDRLPPQNLEAEESILGGIMYDPSAVQRVADKLSPEVFSLTAHEIIYRAIIDLHNNNKPTDLLTIMSWLKDRKLLDKVGGQSKLVQLVDRSVSTLNIDRYADLIIDKYIRRKLIHVGNEVASLGYKTYQELPEICDEVEQKILSITQQTLTNNEGFETISSVSATALGEIEEKSQNPKRSGLTCGYNDLDKITSGFQPGDLVIIAGRPSMGKTAFSVGVGVQVAKLHKIPIAVFSLEMSKEQLVQRMLASEAGIESGRLRIGRITKREKSALIDAAFTISDLPIFLDSSGNSSVNYIRSMCRKLKMEQGSLGIVIIDYLQLMDGSGDNRNNELAKISRALKQMAMELGVTVFALSQLSRSVESRNNKVPVMSDLRDSGSLEQDADLIMMLYRDEYYNKETSKNGIAEIEIVKHRNGPTGTVQMLFDNHLTRFRNMIIEEKKQNDE